VHVDALDAPEGLDDAVGVQVTSMRSLSCPEAVTSRAVTMPPASSTQVVSRLIAVPPAGSSSRTVIE